ncbi:MAG: tetratricopeptide repeat protein [Candidatus Hydrogenedens sp.]
MTNVVPLLSVAMIVRDEEQILPECLKNLKSFVDEICIIDTGSVDGTISIAQSAGAKVKCISWENDFSYARNESLKLCTGKWIFIFDADERLSEEDGVRLRQLAEENNFCAYRLWTRNYTSRIDRSDFQYAEKGDAWAYEFPGWFPSAKVRLFPNLSEIKFEGPVHETVLNSLQQKSIPIVDNEEIIIHHYGECKSKDKILKKQEMYLHLGKKKIQQQPENPYSYAELASQYAEMGRFPDALECYRKALEKETNHPEWWGEVGSLLFILGYKKEAEQSFQIAVKLNTDYYPAWRNLSLLYIETKRWNDSLSTLQQANRIRPDDCEILEIMGNVFLELGEKEKARDCFCHLLKINPNNQKIQEKLKSTQI